MSHDQGRISPEDRIETRLSQLEMLISVCTYFVYFSFLFKLVKCQLNFFNVESLDFFNVESLDQR